MVSVLIVLFILCNYAFYSRCSTKARYYITFVGAKRPNITASAQIFPESAVISKEKRVFLPWKNQNMFEFIITEDANMSYYGEQAFDNFMNDLTENSTIYEVKDIFVNGLGGMIADGHECRNVYDTLMTDTVVERMFDSAVILTNSHIHMFAHIIVDLITPWLLFPEEVRRSATLLIPASKDLVLQFMEILGYESCPCYVFEDNRNFVFCSKLYYLYGNLVVNGHYGIPLRRLSNLIREKLNLSSEPPTLYVMQNREKRSARYVSNFNHIVQWVQKTFNDTKWVIWDTYTTDIVESARKWNTVKFILCPTGSGIANALFMQTRTIICAFFADWFDSPAIFSCITNEVFLYICSQPTTPHFKPRRWVIPENKVLKCVSKSMKLINNDKTKNE